MLVAFLHVPIMPHTRNNVAYYDYGIYNHTHGQQT